MMIHGGEYLTQNRRSTDTRTARVKKTPAGNRKTSAVKGTAGGVVKREPAGEPGEQGRGKGSVPEGPVQKTGGTEGPVPEDHERHGKGGRPFWSGSITIGLVNVPVRLHTMVRDHSFSFRLLHRKDGQPLRYDRVCSRDGTVVPWNETVKGYEVRKGEFLVFEPEELKAVLPESDRKVRIDKFISYLSLDPIFFESSYILVPDRSEEAYSLLVTALQDLNRAAAGTITLRTKEYPAIVHVYDGALILTTLRHGDEVTPPHTFSILPSLPVPKEAELALAKRIIQDLAGDFSINDYPDRYREAVLGLIDRKLAGQQIVFEEPHPEEAKELMEALQETIAAIGRK
jgi:DNA end-binding protein Ku